MIDLTHLSPDEAQQKVRERLSEKDFQARVVARARVYGWRVYHTTIPYRSAPGFPDLVLVRPPRLLFVELKREKGELTTAQEEWLGLLRQCLAEVRVWRPSDEDEIERMLA
jgi:hypothetical protein